MSDIIARAKEALEHSSPRPWKMDLSSPNMNGQNFCIRTDGTAGTFLSGFATRHMADLPLIAAAPELAQALAEETYFYGVQVWMGGRWIMMLTRDHGTGLMHRGKWFERKDEAQACAAKWNHDTPTRIVRQRRSPVEAINE